MLTSFLEGDRCFAKARKEVQELPVVEPRPRRGRRKNSAQQLGGGSEEI
jgi:hypothetical protein